MSENKNTDMSEAFKAYREDGNSGPWNWDADAPADETNTPREQLEILARLHQRTARRSN